MRQDFRYFLLRPIFSFSNTDRWTGRPVTIRSAESLYTSIYVNMYRRSTRNVFLLVLPLSLVSRFLFDYAVCRQRLWRKSVNGASRCVSRDISRFHFFSHSRILSKTVSRVIKTAVSLLPFLFLFSFFCDCDCCAYSVVLLLSLFVV